MCVLYLVPDDRCVVTTVETWAGHLPTFIPLQHYTALLRRGASHTGSRHHVQIKEKLAATEQQEPEHLLQVQSCGHTLTLKSYCC